MNGADNIINNMENLFALRYKRQINLKDRSKLKDEEKIILNSNYKSEFRENNNLPLYIFGNGKKGTVLFIHGTGEKNLKYLKWFPKEFSKLGYTGAMMILPYHFERTPDGYKSGQLFLDPHTDILRGRFENAVVDALTCIDYLVTIRPGPIYIMGYSFGGFISTITAALDKRIKKVSLVVTGGNFYHITWKSFVTDVLRVKYEENGGCDATRCKNYHGTLWTNYLHELKNGEVPFDSAPISCLEYDPVTYARFVEQPTIMFGALFDIFIPRAATLSLKKELSHSEIRWLPSGHLGSIVFKKYILEKTARHFNSRNQFPFAGK